MEETIKPMRGNRSNRNSGIFQDLRQQAESITQTPQRANTMPMGFTEQGLGTPGFMSMANISAEFVKIENGFDSLANGFPSDMSSQPSPHNMAGFGAHSAFENKPDFRPPADFDSQDTMIAQNHGRDSSGSPSRRGSPHRRTESLASIASAASIASINIDETKTDTGVTLDDIAAFIEGPDPADGKWVCVFEKCLKRFGRKENIKSHVQTHLNDRQYQCPTCKKCFVRQHDLKRHAKIHTGIKPYPCECGNSFARHDALTRHRQRGMCIGAFDGIVRKVVKRGRPRKNRPDLDERREKSERTRRKNSTKHASTSSVSSFSGYSDSSAVNSPNNNGFDDLMDDGFPDMMDVAMSDLPAVSSATMNPTSLAVSSAPMPAPEIVDITSPSPSHVAVSPSVMSNYSHTSQADPPTSVAADFNTLPASSSPPHTHNNAASPAKSVASHYTHVPGTPPELSASSSPPPTGHSARFFDLTSGPASSSDPNSSGSAPSAGLMGMDDSDMSLLQFTTDEDGLVQLDGSGVHGLPMHHHGLGMGMGVGKFDDLEEYDAAVSMFTNGDDLFFGGP